MYSYVAARQAVGTYVAASYMFVGYVIIADGRKFPPFFGEIVTQSRVEETASRVLRRSCHYVHGRIHWRTMSSTLIVPMLCTYLSTMRFGLLVAAHVRYVRTRAWIRLIARTVPYMVRVNLFASADPYRNRI